MVLVRHILLLKKNDHYNKAKIENKKYERKKITIFHPNLISLLRVPTIVLYFVIRIFIAISDINNSLQLISFSISSFQENEGIIQRSDNLNEYYENFRNNVMSLLEHVKMPNANSDRVVGGDNFNNYLSKLQTLCNSGVSDETQKPIFDAVKSELQDFTILPTPV